MSDALKPPISTRLSGEDLSFWWLDSPMQPTTMAMLMVLDRRPEESRLRRAFERAVAAVPRLAQRVADAPLDLTLPRWEADPTFDLDYHVRRHTLAGAADIAELFREVAPAYETPFDRSRPLWEARIYDGLAPEHRSAMFFKLHHAVADGVGGNTIFAAMTDWERDPAESGAAGQSCCAKGTWAEPRPLAARVLDALRDRVELDLERGRRGGGCRRRHDSASRKAGTRRRGGAFHHRVGPLRQPLAAQEIRRAGAAPERSRASVRSGARHQECPRWLHDRRHPDRHGARDRQAGTRLTACPRCRS